MDDYLPLTTHRGPGRGWGVFDAAGGLVADVTMERDALDFVTLRNATPKLIELIEAASDVPCHGIARPDDCLICRMHAAREALLSELEGKTE